MVLEAANKKLHSHAKLKVNKRFGKESLNSRFKLENTTL